MDKRTFIIASMIGIVILTSELYALYKITFNKVLTPIPSYLYKEFPNGI